MCLSLEEIKNSLKDAMKNIKKLSKNPRERLVQEINFQAPMYNYFMKKYLTHIEANYSPWRTDKNPVGRPAKCDLRIVQNKKYETWIEIKVAGYSHKNATAKKILHGKLSEYKKRWTDDFEWLQSVPKKLKHQGIFAQRVLIIICFYNDSPDKPDKFIKCVDKFVKENKNIKHGTSDVVDLGKIDWQTVSLCTKAWIWQW